VSVVINISHIKWTTLQRWWHLGYNKPWSKKTCSLYVNESRSVYTCDGCLDL